MTWTFQIEARNQEAVRILALKGFLDAHTAPRFGAAREEQLRAAHSRLVIDCRALDYISSAGLGVFMIFVDEARGRGGDIKLAAIQPKVCQIFDVLGLPALFDIRPPASRRASREPRRCSLRWPWTRPART